MSKEIRVVLRDKTKISSKVVYLFEGKLNQFYENRSQMQIEIAKGYLIEIALEGVPLVMASNMNIPHTQSNLHVTQTWRGDFAAFIIDNL